MPSKQAEQAPADYVRRQTLKGAERFITPELKAFEDKALSAKSRALAREKMLCEALLEDLISQLPPLQDTAGALAELDVLSNLAERALNLDLNCPRFVSEPCMRISQGRRPGGRASTDHAVRGQRPEPGRQHPHAGDHRPEHGR